MKTAIYLFALIAAASAGAQSVPPRPADNGPSLAETMKYIQERLDGQGKVSYVVGPGVLSYESHTLSNTQTDAAGCTVSFNDVQEQQLDRSNDWTVTPPIFALRLVLNPGKAASYHFRRTDKDGSVTERDSGNKEVPIYFQEEELAQRMAKAMVHAVELCGGGDNDPFK